MPEQHRHLANKYEYIVNLQGAEAYCGGLWHSLLFAVYMDDLTDDLHKCGYGLYIGSVFTGTLL